MCDIIKDFGATAILMCLIIAGGRKMDAYLMGIYGGSHLAIDIIKVVTPIIRLFK